ncbi:MAG: phosphoglucosamine mutase [Candidatus Pacebacteria bacterium]|nr:phosphoglucosamine mutase [Candidatus Paceibacterota bacterium]MCD8507859.1 phosphoglucosamine mutase [Candidatus Paceibacterota bacterium]MCD8527832.1 phosphoglucosamine mutase [Candidatus Paceibacterota bacterium]MCD8563538.1 phosphoglucosamine mutase [Candidatus Paceibacterota bacterium]
MNKFSISGLRGIFGESLTREVIEQYTHAYMHTVKPTRIVLGMDTRAHCPQIYTWVTAVLEKYQCAIIDIGVIPTPTAQFMTRTQDVDGGIMITASHNPPEYNGLKFFAADGRYISEDIVAAMTQSLDQVLHPFSVSSGERSTIPHACEMHVDHVLEAIDVDLVRSAGLSVVCDPDGGTGAMINTLLMEKLGVHMDAIYGEPSATFPRGTEPTPENLADLARAVVERGAHIGFAQDPDADRLALVDENGRPIGEEYTLVLVTDYILSRYSGDTPTVVTNLSTSRMMDDVADKHGARLVRTKIGEMHVAQGIADHDALIGGEGNGGIMWPRVSWGRDSVAGMALMCEYLAATKKSLSELVADRPSYYVVKEKREVSHAHDVKKLLDAVREKFSTYTCDETDGIKIIFDQGWLHVRASNTEPIVRIFAEAPTLTMAEGWVREILSLDV